MFLYKCIGFTYITDNILSLINKCNLFINNSQILKCLDKQYIYSKYCNITKDMCNCIENKIIHDYSISDIKYYLITYIILLLIGLYCYYSQYKKISVINGIYIIQNLENDDENTINNNNNNYIIDKTDNLPKYNEIDNEIDNETNILDINNTKITIVELKPPKYDEII